MPADNREILTESLEELESKPVIWKSSTSTNKKVIPPSTNDFVEEPYDERDEAKDYNFKKKRKKNSVYFKEWFVRKYKRNDIVLINLHRESGYRRFLFAPILKDGTFLWRKRKYLLDKEKMYYIENLDMYGYDFDEKLSIPFLPKISILKVKGAVKPTHPEIELLLNPDSLTNYSEQHYGKDVMSGGQLAEEFRRLRLFIIISMIAGVLTLIYLLYSTGAFQNVQNIV